LGPSPTLRGFYLQAASGDGDPATSDGIFVFNGNADSVNLGDLVTVSGHASDFQDQTQVSATQVTVCGTGSVATTDVTLPVPSASYLERFEGMLVRMPQTLYVTEHFQLGRFGQVVMSSGDRLVQPTSVVTPGAPAIAMQAANDLNRLIVDDALQNQNPDPILFGRGGDPLTASNTLRGGDTATGMVGVLSYTWAGNSASGNAYRLRPVGALGGGVPSFVAANPRPSGSPAVGGSLKVVGMNLLNFFNSFGTTGCSFGVGGPVAECRGADDAGEFARQWPKTVKAIIGTGLRYVEKVSGRVTTGRAALTGVGQGAMLGLFWGLLFSLFFTTDTGSFFGVLAFGVVVGAVFGGLVGAISHLMTGGRRDFGSVAETRADRYEVQVDEAYAVEAERLLGLTPTH